MSQCVPSWDLDDGPSHHLQSRHHPSTITRSPICIDPGPMSAVLCGDRRSDYEVAELTWENGQLSMHGHRGGAPRAAKKLAPKDPSTNVPSWEKPGHASGTLEAVVDQATRAAVPAAAALQVPNSGAGGRLVPCVGGKSDFHTLRAPVPAAMDALVPCSNLRPQHGGADNPQPCRLVPDATAGPTDGGGGTCVASCSGRKRTRHGAGDGNCSVTGSAASRGLATFDTCDINDAGEDTGFTSDSPVDESPETENASCGRPLALAEDHDSVCYSRRTLRDGCYEEEKIIKGDVGRSSVSTKRSRAAAVHNQSERKRRDRINQKMKTLQKLVPNSNKTDKASILDEAIEYLKQLQAQVQMMNRMSSVPHMMMPMTMQHMQMAMMAGQMAQMAQMGMGMMDMNSLGRAEHPGLVPVLSTPPPPPPFLLPSTSWPDAPSGADRLPAGTVLPQDAFASFMACQNQQPTTMDAYGRMAAMYRQLYQQPSGTNPKT